MRRSVSTQLYNVLVKGTEEGQLKWERVTEGTDSAFQTKEALAGHIVTISLEQVEESTDDDSGERWVVVHNSTKVGLNLKQTVLARKVAEQIDGDARSVLMEEADNLASALASELGIDFNDEDDSEDEDE